MMQIFESAQRTVRSASTPYPKRLFGVKNSSFHRVEVVRMVIESDEVVASALAQANLSALLTSGRHKQRRHIASLAITPSFT